MLSFRPEWHEAPGVKDRALAATWARLEIQAGDDTSHCVSRVLSTATNSTRQGVYGSLLPLAEWIVENWWFLLHEPCRVPEFPGGRRLAGDLSQRPWVQRHCVLAAREGVALPDLTIYRDGAHVAVHWKQDLHQAERSYPVRFIEEGSICVPDRDVEKSLQGIVEAVIERVPCELSESLRANWNAVCDSRIHESELCSWAASLGLDPYDEHELTEETENILRARVGTLTSSVRNDFLEASTSRSLVSDLDWLDEARAAFNGDSSNGHSAGQPLTVSAHQYGYDAASRFRSQLSLPTQPITNLGDVLNAQCAWPEDYERLISTHGSANLMAMVGRDSVGQPRLAATPTRHRAQRFRLARAVFFLHGPGHSTPPRLVTTAYTWDQRASRAFAAELLAPAEALRASVGPTASLDQVEQLARSYDVSPMVIEHQLSNHQIAWVDKL